LDSLQPLCLHSIANHLLISTSFPSLRFVVAKQRATCSKVNDTHKNGYLSKRKLKTKQT